MSKDKIINFKVEDEVKAEFKKVCQDNFTTPSHQLRLYVRKYIKVNSEAIQKKK